MAAKKTTQRTINQLLYHEKFHRGWIWWFHSWKKSNRKNRMSCGFSANYWMGRIRWIASLFWRLLALKRIKCTHDESLNSLVVYLEKNPYYWQPTDVSRARWMRAWAYDRKPRRLNTKIRSTPNNNNSPHVTWHLVAEMHPTFEAGIGRRQRRKVITIDVQRRGKHRERR